MQLIETIYGMINALIYKQEVIMKTIMKWLKDLTRVKHPRKLKSYNWS